jgi:exopolysaccharide biosynthesis polyprenyl glycosylphosphotransferase
VRVGRYGVAAAVLAALSVESVAALERHPHGAAIGAAAIGLCTGAAIFDLHLRRAGNLHRPVRLLAVGAGDPGRRLAAAFEAHRPRSVELVGFLRLGDEPQVAARPMLGRLEDLERVARERAIDAIVLANPTRRLDVLEEVLAIRGPAPAVIELSDAYERAFGRVPVSEINAAWFLRALALSRRTALVFPKRLLDLAIASAALLVAAPLGLAIAVAVKLDSPGPVLYRQRRVGEAGREFTMLKFRSMCEDAERDGAARWAAERDPRITRVGRVLRRFRLDEIPQFWNVLRGEMTVVGPRPERPEMVATLCETVPFYDSRHLARPGITGWAQVYAPYGASVDDALQKLSYDLYYLNHSSLCTDLGIMLRTAGVMLAGRGAR